jgi:hypothetical protein
MDQQISDNDDDYLLISKLLKSDKQDPNGFSKDIRFNDSEEKLTKRIIENKKAKIKIKRNNRIKKTQIHQRNCRRKKQ